MRLKCKLCNIIKLSFKMSCDICIEKFNKTVHKECSCPFCDFKACYACNKKYLLDSVNDPDCMNCHRGFLREHMIALFPKSFVLNDHKQQREKILYDREKCMLPATQIEVEREDKIKVVNDLIKEVNQKKVLLIKELFNIRYKRSGPFNVLQYQIPTPAELVRIKEIGKELHKLGRERSDYTRRKNDILYGQGQQGQQQEKREFIKKCPAEGCNGYLSSQWKCGLCNTKVCNKCLEIKNTGDEEHTCDPENVKTAELINKETKPCPACGIRITKLIGCFAKDTPIMMWSGGAKMSQNIEVDDVLVGDDGLPRTVQELVSGEDTLYEVTQSNGITYTVNSKHTLVLLKQVYEKMSNIVEITVEDYMKLMDAEQEAFKGFQSVFPVKDLDISDTTTKITRIQSSEIFVRCIGSGPFYGWRVDGNHRFILEDHTVVRNCSQMWCTHCHVAFDWNSLRIVTGQIHNPHFYEYQRQQNGGVAPRVPGDIPGGCEDIPPIWTCNFVWNNAKFGIDPSLQKSLSSMHRMITHVQYFEITRYPHENVAQYNNDIRKKFLRNEIDEKKFKWLLQRREKSRQKGRELRQLFEMWVACAKDLIRRSIQENISTQHVNTIIDEFHSLCNYFNEQSMKIKSVFEGKVPVFEMDGSAFCQLLTI